MKGCADLIRWVGFLVFFSAMVCGFASWRYISRTPPDFSKRMRRDELYTEKGKRLLRWERWLALIGFLNVLASDLFER
jgi:hypothetical protein